MPSESIHFQRKCLKTFKNISLLIITKVLDRRKKGLLGCFSDTQPSPCTRHGEHQDEFGDDAYKHDDDEDDCGDMLINPLSPLMATPRWTPDEKLLNII